MFVMGRFRLLVGMGVLEVQDGVLGMMWPSLLRSVKWLLWALQATLLGISQFNGRGYITCTSLVIFDVVGCVFSACCTSYLVHG